MPGEKAPLSARQARSETNSSFYRLRRLTPFDAMPRRKIPGTESFALDISSEAKSRFATLHAAFGLKTKAATFETILFAVTLKDKIDPQILHRIDANVARVLEKLEDAE